MVGGAERRRRGRMQEGGLMVTVTVGGQLQLETYDRLTQSRTNTHTHKYRHTSRKSQCPLLHTEGPIERQ